jgi:streptogramin lyase
VIRLALAAIAAAVAAAPGLPGARTTAVCAAAGDFWPTETIAVDGKSLWVACKEDGRLQRVDAATGRVRLRVAVPGGLHPVAVASGFRALWVVTDGGTVLRLDPATGRRRASIDAGLKLYNVWIGAGSVWVVDDAVGEVVRIDPARNRVAARYRVGDGPASIAFSGTSAYVMNHRDTTLVRIATDAGRVEQLADIQADAPERIALLGGRLWITGRGTDLLEVDPANGNVVRTIEIGASGVDVIAAGGALWIPVRTAAADPRGFPTIGRVARVDPRSGAVRTVATARGRVDIHGIAADRRFLWLADNTSGRLHRLPLR